MTGREGEDEGVGGGGCHVDGTARHDRERGRGGLGEMSAGLRMTCGAVVARVRTGGRCHGAQMEQGRRVVGRRTSGLVKVMGARRVSRLPSDEFISGHDLRTSSKKEAPLFFFFISFLF